ncbi:Outer membrane protein TolC [Candidatus Kryptonium thompsonii]|jgi:outer membrane protein TolC|uniref:Outer membrane protein TolC n=1 Tax=Candidatus Kryptonium thompsonii TaxID=1633631 RepID=A0A0P1M829_9BACT|nr:TolC family protein [Candidatus Kryptonium thompsoni]CUS78295.1 Outer membrane protein TolC [Candidatus Kryptonium thompsoni]CUS78369.1 Outer membrane protein TolC [Candidatus Kryptonium thompsoni]CUS79113.1 Outer membrane protein TolC [Candidatus Kryptonium thompsoni]CUS79848.1 Outer membrane protein TolC [Candidatus Kryptonium thompsoni]CUS88588.1 Outer membrane protein TolC [Candidatus Kryptonium thompsoni]
MKALILFVLLPVTLLSQPKVLTLEDAVKIALENNNQVRTARLELIKSDEKLVEARSNLIPQITLSGSYSRYLKKPVLFLPPDSPFGRLTGGVIEIGFDNSYIGLVNLQMPIFSWSVYAGINTANKGRLIAEQTYKSVALKTISDVKKAFYNVLLVKEAYKITKMRIELAEDNLKNVEKMYRQGIASEYDYINAQVQYQNLQPLLVQAENNLELAQNALKFLLGIDVNQEIDVVGEMNVDNFTEIDYTNALKELYENNPDIKQAEYQIELSRSLVSLELSGHLPALFLTGNLQYQAQANDFNFNRYRWIRTTFIGLQLQIPIFRGFGTQARIDQARVSLQQSTERLRFIKQALENELKGTIYKIEQSKKRIEAQKKAVELAELGYKIARKRFESGVGTQLEVSNAEVNFAQARLNYQQAIYDYLTALSDLERLIGKINY